MKKLVKSFILLATASIGLAACGSSVNTSTSSTATSASSSEVTASQDKTFYVSSELKGTGDRVPYVWQDGGFTPYLLYRALLLSDAKLETTQPDLAKEWKKSEDGLTYEFTLKDDLKWSDGQPLTGEDVRFSAQLALKAAVINGIFPGALSKVVGAEDYKNDQADTISGIQVDGNKVTFTLNNPVGNFEQVMAQFYILPKHALEKEDPLQLNNSDFWTNPVTNGMYKVKEINAGNYVEMERNEYFENEKPKFDKVVLNFISDPVLALQDGKSYMYTTNKPQEISQLDSISALTKKPIDILFYRYFIMNLSGVDGNGDSPLADVRVRQAILYAINRDELAKSIFPEVSDVNYTGVPTNLPDFWSEANRFEYNPEKAKELLAEANYDGSKPLILTYYYKDQASQDFMQAVSYQLEQVGIKSEVTQIQSDATSALFKLRKYDIGYKGFSTFGYESWYGEYASSNTNFSNIYNGDTSFDALTKQLSETSDPAQRKTILEDLQRLEQEKLFKLNLFTFKNFIYINTDKVALPEGTELGNPLYQYDYQFAQWDAKE